MQNINFISAFPSECVGLCFVAPFYFSQGRKKRRFSTKIWSAAEGFFLEKHTDMCLKSAHLMCTYVEEYERIHVLKHTAIILLREAWR